MALHVYAKMSLRPIGRFLVTIKSLDIVMFLRHIISQTLGALIMPKMLIKYDITVQYFRDSPKFQLVKIETLELIEEL